MSINNKKWCNWDDLFKSNSSKPSLRKIHTERVPKAQYHQDKPVGTLNKNSEAPVEEKDQIPAAPKNKPGEIPRRPTNIEISSAILANLPKQMRQPTSAEQIEWARATGLIKSEEDQEQLQKDWEGRLNDFYKAAKAPVDDQSSKKGEAWAPNQSFNDSLSEEERLERNTFVSNNENE